MRSREAKTLFACLALITLAAAVFGAAVAGAGAAVSATVCGIFCMVFAAAFCIRRAREIDGLSEYLASVYTGGEILDIRTQREGELNALRDDIYKITTILGEQKAGARSGQTPSRGFSRRRGASAENAALRHCAADRSVGGCGRPRSGENRLRAAGRRGGRADALARRAASETVPP